jgi:hypothetical protein
MAHPLSLPSRIKQLDSSLKPLAGAPPIFLAMVGQACAAGVTLLLLAVLTISDQWGELFAALCHGLTAAVIGRVMRLAIWWMPINFLFVPAALLLLGSSFGAQWFLVAFVALVLVYWSTYRTQVPLYLTSGAGCKVVAEIVEREKSNNFLDLGSGSGSMLVHLAKRLPTLSCDGVELAPVPFWVSRLRLAFRRNCCVNWKDLWSVDLSRYDVVYAFLSPVPMSALWEKVRHEMRPGTLFISNSFPVMGVAPKETVIIPGPIKRKLYLWRL